jgi:antitoxin (DNA-binding transcriptional repressor) of toxin-antitoxin stability system
MNMTRIMTATGFRAKCLGLFDWVARTGETIVLTKRGKPMARAVPVPSSIEPGKSSEVGAKAFKATAKIV